LIDQLAHAGLQRWTVRQSLESRPDAVSAFVASTVRALGELNKDRDRIEAVEIVLAEVLNNIVEHAYEARADGWISLSMRDCGSHLLCEIEDGGKPMPQGRLPAGDAPCLDVAQDALPEGGYGWFLIRLLTENLHYHRIGATNRVVFHLPLPDACAA
jgi:serine/threonine-protein kinase RsbW